GGGTCSQDIQVDVIDAQIAYGAYDVPVRLEYMLDPPGNMLNIPPTPQDLNPPQTQIIQVSPSTEVNFYGKFAYPSFDQQVLHGEYWSDDEQNALILANGDDYDDRALAKGIQPPYAGQVPIPTILSDYINSETGLVTLGDNEALVLFELGTSNPASAAFDFNDLILKITTDCAVGSEVVLRDSIGNDNTTTNDNWPWGSSKITSGNWTLDVFQVSAPQSLRLTTIRGIAGKLSVAHDFSTMDYVVRIWSNLSAATSSPNLGNVLPGVTFDAPSVGPSPFGQTIDQGPWDSLGTYDMSFDISNLNVQLTSSQTVAIGIQFITPGGGAGAGIWGWQESTQIGSSDVQVTPSGWNYIENIHPQSLHDGRLGMKVSGVSTNP
ncbi:MAG: hypothetical protein DCC75_09900, partial [Proteobacteria bacterium]